MAAKSAKEQFGVDLPEPNRPEQQEGPPAPAEERPDWLPENFKDEREFAAAYKSAQDKIREQGEASKGLEAQISQLTEVVQNLRPPEAPAAATDDGLKDQLLAAFENDPIGTMAYLAQQYATQTVEEKLKTIQQENNPAAVAQMEAQNQLLAMTVDRALNDRFDDWNDYKEKVGAEITADNTLLPERALQHPETAIKALSRVYEVVKARELLDGQQNGNFVSTQMKRNAQTIPGAAGRPGEPSADDAKMEALINAAKGMSYSAWRGNG